MPMLYQAMTKLYRPRAQSPPQSKWILGSGRPRAIAHQAGMTKLSGVIGATDCLAKTDALAWKPLHKFTTRHLDRVVWLRYHLSNRLKSRHIQGEQREIQEIRRAFARGRGCRAVLRRSTCDRPAKNHYGL